jgi:serine protease
MVSYVLRISLCFVALFAVISCGGSNKLSTASAVEGTFSLSGKVTIQPSTSVDQDTNQRFQGLVEQNNSAEEAQLINNPLTLGGYLSGGSDENGEFPADHDDYFRVALVENQAISLSVFLADSSRLSNRRGNIEVSLSLSLVGTSDQTTENIVLTEVGAKSVNVPETGDYIIRVHAENNTDAVLYTLSLLQTLFDSSAPSSNSFYDQAMKYDFVPGEVLIKLKSGPGQENSKIRKYERPTKNASEELIQRHGLVTKRELSGGAILYAIDDDALGNRITLEASLSSRKSAKKVTLKWQTLQAIETLKQDPHIEYAEPNYIRKSAAIIPNDVLFDQQWNISMLGLTSAWELSTGSGALVAVIDTGINSNHVDLSSNISRFGFDFISDVDSSGDGDGYDNDPTDLSVTSHGSHVAGIIAATANNSEGIAGVAYNAQIMPLRVLGIENDDGVSEGNDSDIAAAILYASGIGADAPERRADIINLSLGGPAISNTLEDAIQSALSQGIIVIAAAGNENTSEFFYPAAFEGVVGVSSVTNERERSSFSNFGLYIDVAAPGGSGAGQGSSSSTDSVLSTISGQDYVGYSGTSMAAPHVAGVAALMKSVKPDLDYSGLLYALENGEMTDEIGSEFLFGNGLINAAKAVTWASDGGEIPDTLIAFPSQFSFVNADTASTLFLSNPGAGSVVIDSIVSSEDWVEISPLNVASGGLGSYSVKVNSTAIPLNTFGSASLTLTYTINDAEENEVLVDVLASNSIEGNETVGNLYISLIALDDVLNTSSEDLQALETVSGSLNNGAYDYQFSELLQGSYFVRASTNNDGDQFTFDKGEAKGIYPSISTVSAVTVENTDLSDIDFDVEFYEANREITGNDIAYPYLFQTQKIERP